MRRRPRSVVASRALTEETGLLVSGTLLTAQARQTRRQPEVALSWQLGDLAARHALQSTYRGAETLVHSRRVEVGEVTHRVKAQAPPRGREVAVPQRVERETTTEGRRLPRRQDHPPARGHLRTEEPLGHPEGHLNPEHVVRTRAHGREHRLVTSEEPTRSSQGQDVEPQAH